MRFGAFSQGKLLQTSLNYVFLAQMIARLTRSRRLSAKKEQKPSQLAEELVADSAMTLSRASAGCQLRIRQLDGVACQRLREIGFCEELEISKISDGRNMICSVCGTRLALSKSLGDQVLVEMV